MKNIKDKNSFLYKAFMILIILTFSLATYWALGRLLLNAYFRPDMLSILITIFLAISIAYIILNKLKLSKKQKTLLIIGIILLGIVLRILSMLLLKTHQVSDFANPERMYKYLQENGSFKSYDSSIHYHDVQNNFSLFPTWYNYCYIIVAIFDIFGFNPEYIKVLNIILYIITALFLYKGTKKLFSDKVAILATLIFSICPSMFIYSNVASPDHFIVMFMSICIYIWAKLLENKDNKKLKIKYSSLLIIFMLLINRFKSLSIYLLLAFLCSEILINIKWNKKEIKSYMKENLKYLLIFTFTFISLNLVVNKVNNYFIEKDIKLTIKDSTSMYLLWGYTLNEDLEYDSNYIYTPLIKELREKYENDYEKILKDLSKVAKENFVNNIKYLPKIWFDKSEELFSNEGHYFSFANTNNNKEHTEFISLKYYNMFLLTANSFMGLNYLMIIIYCIKSYKDTNKSKENSIILLMIMGFIAILILGGVQSRYKSIISPQLSIIFALGIITTIDFIKLKIPTLKISKHKGGFSINVDFSNNSSL